MALGMLLRGSSVSSPSEAAPSKPPKDRNAKTVAKATVESEIPLGTENTLKVKLWLPGAAAPDDLHEDHHHEDRDQADRDALQAQEEPGDDAHVAVGDERR